VKVQAGTYTGGTWARQAVRVTRAAIRTGAGGGGGSIRLARHPSRGMTADHAFQKRGHGTRKGHCGTGRGRDRSQAACAKPQSEAPRPARPLPAALSRTCDRSRNRASCGGTGHSCGAACRAPGHRSRLFRRERPVRQPLLRHDGALLLRHLAGREGGGGPALGRLPASSAPFPGLLRAHAYRRGALPAHRGHHPDQDRLRRHRIGGAAQHGAAGGRRHHDGGHFAQTFRPYASGHSADHPAAGDLWPPCAPAFAGGAGRARHHLLAGPGGRRSAWRAGSPQPRKPPSRPPPRAHSPGPS